MLSVILITAILVVALPQYRITTLSMVRSISLSSPLIVSLAIPSVICPMTSLFTNIISVDLISISLISLSLIVFWCIMTFYTSRITTSNYTPYTFSIVVLIILIGTYYLMTSNDLVTIVISLELQSFSIYAITSIYRWREGATSAGLIYFILGAFSSGLVLLGVSMVYALTSSTDYDLIRSIALLGHQPSITIAMTLILAGFLFKVTASPFHFWGPDVYDRVPTIITILITIIPKFALTVFIMRMTAIIMPSIHWLLMISVVLSFTFGSVIGLVQTRIKRLLAYSTISHVGWMLISISMGTIIGVGSFGFYLTQYSITTGLSFLCLIAIGYTNLISQSSDVNTINTLSGIYIRSITLSIIISITLYSAAGIPPMIGFYAKLSILQGMLFQGQYLIAFIGVLSSIVSAGFYLSVISIIFFT